MLKPIEDYLPLDNTVIHVYNESVLADFATRLHICNQNNGRQNNHFIETATSYLGVRKILIQLHDSLFCQLLKLSVSSNSDLETDVEKSITDYIVYSKILIDLFVVLTKTIVYGNPFLENLRKKGIEKYVDVIQNGFPKESNGRSLSVILNKLKDEYSWSKYIRETRDLLVHQGYAISYTRLANGPNILLGKRNLTHIIPPSNLWSVAPILSVETFNHKENKFSTIDLELIARGIFLDLPKVERALLLELEKLMIVEDSVLTNYKFKDLRRVKVKGC